MLFNLIFTRIPCIKVLGMVELAATKMVFLLDWVGKDVVKIVFMSLNVEIS